MRCFVKFLRENTELPVDDSAEWGIGFEVCFYRDVLHHKHQNKKDSGSSFKRTFDLALFSEQEIVIIEAKAYERFITTQTQIFEKDKKQIQRLLGQKLDIWLVALASSKYYANLEKHGRSHKVLMPFDGKLTWASVAKFYNNPILNRAEDIYQ